MITDAAERRIKIPAAIFRIVAAGPPAAALLYSLAPDKMIGWVQAMPPQAKPFLAPSARDLPEIGRLTGRGGATNLSLIEKLKPDLIVDYGTVNPTYADLADRVQQQTGIAYILLDGSLDRLATVYRQLGELAGIPGRAERLAGYAEETLGLLRTRIGTRSAAGRPKVFLARGGNGLAAHADGTLNADVLDRLGAVNVASDHKGHGADAATVEQVRQWAPDVVLAFDGAFPSAASSDPAWMSVAAIRDKRLFLVPSLPFGWLDTPPSANRLIGLRWLASILYPDLFPEDVRGVTKHFYQLFYQVDLTEDQLDTLLVSQPQTKRE